MNTLIFFFFFTCNHICFIQKAWPFIWSAKVLVLAVWPVFALVRIHFPQYILNVVHSANICYLSSPSVISIEIWLWRNHINCPWSGLKTATFLSEMPLACLCLCVLECELEEGRISHEWPWSAWAHVCCVEREWKSRLGLCVSAAPGKWERPSPPCPSC